MHPHHKMLTPTFKMTLGVTILVVYGSEEGLHTIVGWIVGWVPCALTVVQKPDPNPNLTLTLVLTLTLTVMDINN